MSVDDDNAKWLNSLIAAKIIDGINSFAGDLRARGLLTKEAWDSDELLTLKYEIANRFAEQATLSAKARGVVPLTSVLEAPTPMFLSPLLVDQDELYKELSLELEDFGSSLDDADRCHTFDIEAIAHFESELGLLHAWRTHGTNHQLELEAASLLDVEKALQSWTGDEHTRFMDKLRHVLGEVYSVHRLHTHPPPGESLHPYYDAAWDDFILVTPSRWYLLHLGVSD